MSASGARIWPVANKTLDWKDWHLQTYNAWVLLMAKINLAIGLCILALLALACGGGNTLNDATGTAKTTVPTISTEAALLSPTALPTATPLVAGPDVRPCAAVDLKAVVIHGTAVDGEEMATIRLGDRSATSCQISGLPEVRLQDERTRDLPITVSSAAVDGQGQPMVLLPDVALDPAVALLPGQAWLQLGWRAGAGICPTEPPRATFLVLVLPDTGSQFGVDVTGELPSGIAPCDGTVRVVSYGPGTAQ